MSALRPRMERLETRRALSGGLTFESAVAGETISGVILDNITMPADAVPEQFTTGWVSINYEWGQYDYTPRVVKNADGTYDIISDEGLTFSGGGERAIEIIYRANTPRSWNTLISTTIPVEENVFDGKSGNTEVMSNRTKPVLGLPFRGSFATFTPTGKGAVPTNLRAEISLQKYNAGYEMTTLPGRVDRNADGSVSVGIDGPMDYSGEFFVRLFDADTGAVVGTFGNELYAYPMQPFGFFKGNLSEDGETVSINLSNNPHGGKWAPAGRDAGYDSTLTVKLQLERGEKQKLIKASIAQNADGDWIVTAKTADMRPGDLDGSSMIRVYETVDRPAIGNAPAKTIEVEYVGSWDASSSVPITPEPISPGAGSTGTTGGTIYLPELSGGTIVWNGGELTYYVTTSERAEPIPSDRSAAPASALLLQTVTQADPAEAVALAPTTLAGLASAGDLNSVLASSKDDDVLADA